MPDSASTSTAKELEELIALEEEDDAGVEEDTLRLRASSIRFARKALRCSARVIDEDCSAAIPAGAKTEKEKTKAKRKAISERMQDGGEARQSIAELKMAREPFISLSKALPALALHRKTATLPKSFRLFQHTTPWQIFSSVRQKARMTSSQRTTCT